MKVLITGGTGFVGQQLVRKLLQIGITPVVLSRNIQKAQALLGELPDYYAWDALSGPPPPEAFESVTAIVNLMGEGVAEKRWTATQRKRMWDSRVTGTRHLVQGALTFAPKLDVFISASAIGYYDHEGPGDRDEQSPSATHFMAKLCQAWESESTAINNQKTIRDVRLRIGVVVGAGGGAIDKMKYPYLLGIGGSLGNGNQWMNWIHRDDLVDIMVASLQDKKYSGVYNAVSPGNVTNATFSGVLASLLHRPNLFKVPRFVLKLMLGEMAAVVLDGAKVVPERLNAAGFTFKHTQLTPALKEALHIKFIAHLNQEVACERFYVQQWLEQNQKDVFAFFSEAKNLERITPPFVRFKITHQSTPDIQSGTLFDYRLKIRGIPIRWRTEILDWNPITSFVDTQLRGPYKVWHHTHRFYTFGNGTLCEDEVYFALPAVPLFAKLVMIIVKKDVKKIFDFRKKVIDDVLGKPEIVPKK